MKKLLAGMIVLALALAGFAAAASTKDTYRLVANLKPRNEVPRPTGVRPGAVGLFTGTAVEGSNDSVKLTWRLSFSKLTGPATAAHVHSGKPGTSGNVLLPLCGPCTKGQRGTATITHAQLDSIRSGATYVNVHTQKNPGGEIRGQLKSSGGAVVTTTTSTTPAPVYP